MATTTDIPTPAELSARCHEIQTGLGTTEVPDFDTLTTIGMAVRLALHIRGLPAIPFEVLKLVAYHFLGISLHATRGVLHLLADIEFVRLGTQGHTINTVLPDVPYYEELYTALGEYSQNQEFNEAEQLSVALLHRLAASPQKLDRLRNQLGADRKLLDRVVTVGKTGAYIRLFRARGRDILLTPTHFSENPEVFADAIAAGGAHNVERLLTALKHAQGHPLSLIQKTRSIAGNALTTSEVQLLLHLCQHGALKPPSLTTPHTGENFFLFTPTPSGAALAPTKRDIYEKSMAIVAAVRQGQHLPKRYAIRSPQAVLHTLHTDLQLGRATTEAAAQYKELVHLRIATLEDVGFGFKRLRIIDTEENREALKIACELVGSGTTQGLEVDDEARRALQEEQTYVDSLIASGRLHQTKRVPISEEHQQQLELILLKA